MIACFVGMDFLGPPGAQPTKKLIDRADGISTAHLRGATLGPSMARTLGGAICRRGDGFEAPPDQRCAPHSSALRIYVIQVLQTADKAVPTVSNPLSRWAGERTIIPEKRIPAASFIAHELQTCFGPDPWWTSPTRAAAATTTSTIMRQHDGARSSSDRRSGGAVGALAQSQRSGRSFFAGATITQRSRGVD